MDLSFALFAFSNLIWICVFLRNYKQYRDSKDECQFYKDQNERLFGMIRVRGEEIWNLTKQIQDGPNAQLSRELTQPDYVDESYWENLKSGEPSLEEPLPLPKT
jgi:hypothetical protein